MKQAAVSPLYLVCGVLVLEFHSVLEYSLVVQSETICFSPERNEIEFFFCCGCLDASYLSKITINTYVYLPKGLEHKMGTSTWSIAAHFLAQYWKDWSYITFEYILKLKGLKGSNSSGALLNRLQCSLHSLSGVYSVDCLSYGGFIH